MIERSLYFALGFLMALMMALAVLPAFWRRAYRLTRREVEATLPLSPREIAAERDQLRAKFAVERIQLEQQVEAISKKRHDDMKLTGTKTATIAEMGDTLQARQASIDALTLERNQQEKALSQLRQLQEETNGALSQRSAELETTVAARLELRHKLDASETLNETRQNEITALKLNMAAQFQRVEDMATAVRLLKEQLKTSIDEAKVSERKLREAEKDRSILSRRLEAAEELGVRRDAALADRDQKVTLLHEKAVALSIAGKELEISLKKEARKAAQAEALLKAREESITRLREDSAETARDLTRSIEKVRADRQKLQTELGEARAAAAILQRELNALKRSASVSDLKIARHAERTAK